jgi:hypothetical protein
MMSYTENAGKILSSIGLTVHMNTIKDDPLYMDLGFLYNNSVFKSYSPEWYRNNKKLHESDEIYNFSTTVYMHLKYGIRCEYDIHESYYSETYKLRKLFIISKNNDALDISDVNFNDEYFETEKGRIPFSIVKRIVEVTD